MKLAVLSEIHDNIWQIELALATCWSADALICYANFSFVFML